MPISPVSWAALGAGYPLWRISAERLSLAVMLVLATVSCGVTTLGVEGAAQGVSAGRATAVDTAYANTIRWRTASELDNFGFDVYRAELPDGPFERINPDVIEGAGTTDEPQSYEFVDDTIDPRRTYYYYVESISMSGIRERFTPIGKARPKVPPRDGKT